MLPGGSYVALVTPMDGDNKIQWHIWHELLDWHLESKTAGIVILGTTGESPTITAKERCRLIQETTSHISGKIPVLVGVGSNSTQVVCDLMQEAALFGADAGMAVTPYYNMPNQNGVYEHFKKIATTVDLPFLLYNVPSRTGFSLSVDTVAKLALLNNIVGIKEASGDLNYLLELRELLPANFLLFSGDDSTVVDFIRAGGHGVISVIANVLPLHMVSLCQAVLLEDTCSVIKIFDEIKVLIDACKLDVNPSPIKYMLSLINKIGKGIRLPLLPLDYQQQQQVKDVMGRMGLLPAVGVLKD